MSMITDDLRNSDSPMAERCIEEIERLEQELADSNKAYGLLFAENGKLKDRIAALSQSPTVADEAPNERERFMAWANDEWKDRTIPDNAWLGWRARAVQSRKVTHEEYVAVFSDEVISNLRGANGKLHRELAAEKETSGQLVRALREATEPPTFMGEPVSASVAGLSDEPVDKIWPLVIDFADRYSNYEECLRIEVGVNEAGKKCDEAETILRDALASRSIQIAPADEPTAKGWKRLVRIPINATEPAVFKEKWIACNEDDPGAIKAGHKCTICGGDVDLSNASKPAQKFSMQGRASEVAPSVSKPDYEKVERDTLGDPDKQTGIYAASTTPIAGEPTALPYGIIDPEYARFFTQARIVAWKYGWALTMHGSFTRDLDLVLVPWTELAVDHKLFLQYLCKKTGTMFGGEGTVKPCGRRVYTLHFKENAGDVRWIDLSVMPLAAKSDGEEG